MAAYLHLATTLINYERICVYFCSLFVLQFFLAALMKWTREMKEKEEQCGNFGKWAPSQVLMNGSHLS